MLGKMRAAGRLVLVLSLLFLGLLAELFAFPLLDLRKKESCIRIWSRSVLWACGIRIQVAGEPSLGAFLLAANHASWLDILTINSVQPAQFVAKAEIRDWPLVGLLVARAGTHFIERTKRRAVHSVLQELVKALQAGRVVAVFPEGTTNDGTCLKPFHANFLQAALDAQVPLKPLGIRYENADGSLSSAIEYIGEMTFVASMWQVLQLKVIVAKLNWGEPIVARGTRHALTAIAEASISDLSGLPRANTSALASRHLG